MATETLKTVPAPTIKPITSPNIPKEVADKNFSLDEFEVEQLPEQGKTETSPETKSEGAGELSTSTKPAKGTDVATEESPQRSDGGAERGDDELEASSGEAAAAAEGETKPKLPKFLKPPKGKEEVKVEGEKGTEVKPIVPKQSTRDYSGLSEEEVKAGKNMSVEAFSVFKKAVMANKELSSLKEQTIMQHPQAYILDPTYQQTRTELTFAQKEANYWEQQLINMDNGQELVPITGFDAKTGEPILGKPIQPTKALEERVRMNIHNCYNAAQQLNAKMQEYPAKYQQSIQKDLQDIEGYRKQQFGWVNDPSLLNYSVPVEGLGDRTLKQIKEDVQNILPKWMHSHPLTSVLGDLVIALRIKQAELAEATGSQAVQKTKEEEQELVEPSSKSKGSVRGKGAKVHGIDEFVIDPSLGV